MGRKRKQEKSEEEIRRKIKKLEDQLAQTTARNVEELPLEESLNNLPMELLDTPYVECVYESPLLDTNQYNEPYPELSCLLSPHLPSPCHELLHPPSTHHVLPHPPSPHHVLPQATTSSPSQPGTSADGNKETTGELEEDILQLLGDAPRAETSLGPAIHKDVARRWQDILAKGLPKEVKETLLKQYLVPSNCDFLVPAALNLEVKAALPDALVKRDVSLAYKQKQLGVALSALATVVDLVLASETSKQKILKPLSDACRILCDNHYSDTKTRRGFVISAINTKLRDALIESNRDKLLFGENMSEKLKAAKTIQQSGDALKNTQKPKFQRPNLASTSANNNKGRLNFVPQHRKTDNKPNDGRRVSNYTQRQSTSTNARRPTDRPLPARAPASQRR